MPIGAHLNHNSNSNGGKRTHSLSKPPLKAANNNDSYYIPSSMSPAQQEKT